jgi:hypothetical protein
MKDTLSTFGYVKFGQVYDQMKEFCRESLRVLRSDEWYIRHLHEERCSFFYLFESQVCELIEILLGIGKYWET